ncbi:MAG: EndoU domain-containing protein [Rhodospirillaceae bacterium]
MRWLCVVVIAFVLVTHPAAATETLTTAATCPAANRIADVAGSTETLAPGRYAVVDRHRSGEFVRLRTPRGDRWVPTDCSGTPKAQAALPFFDHVDEGPGDMQPPPPLLDAFDHAVLELCGTWGSTPDRAAFTALMNGHPDIAAAAGGLEALSEAWFGADGFAHIFCGEPSSDNLAGFHYQGRYLQAQRNGWASFTEACSVQERDGPIRSFGVQYRVPGGGTRTQCPKGFVHGQSARDLMLAATKAWREAGGRHAACLAPVAGAPRGRAVVVMRNGALRTYYGDATPDLSLPECRR